MREANRLALRQCREIVWLTASPKTIEERLAGDPATPDRRPNLTNSGGRNEIERLLAERTPIYRSCATLEVDTENKAPAEIADEIVTALGLVS
jgi:shikimate kinase